MIVIGSATGAANPGGAVPATVTGTGTNPQTFGPQLNMPGSNRLSGTPFTVRASGTIQANVSSNVQLTLYANYPSGQYPAANITNAVGNTTGGANIALYNANNNFVIGQYVTVAGTANALNGNVGPLVVANATAFAGQVNGVNVANTAAATYTGTATIAPQPLYVGLNTGPAMNVGAVVPWALEFRGFGDNVSNIISGYGTDQQVNANVVSTGPNAYFAYSTTGQVNPVPGVNFKNEPPVYFTLAETFGASNAANTATLKSFYLED